MNWQPIDFYGINALEPSVLGQLEDYLRENEAKLSHEILSLFHPNISSESAPIKLSDAVDDFTKLVRALSKEELEKAGKKEDIIRPLNKSLWCFTEVLEGCVVELFQQVSQSNMDHWSHSLLDVIRSVNVQLLHHIENLTWVIKRLAIPLKEYENKCFPETKKHWISRFKSYRKQMLDPTLLDQLAKTEKLLKSKHDAFCKQYQDYSSLSEKVNIEIEKLKKCTILTLMELFERDLYIKCFRLLKFWELNTHPKSLLGTDIIRSLKQLSSVDSMIQSYRSYFQDLKMALFRSSLEFKWMESSAKKNLGPELFQESKDQLSARVRGYQHELKQFAFVVIKYRDFILKTDSNPYVRSRWGFPEWTVGPEPEKSKELLRLIYKVEQLSQWYSQFLVSLSHPLTKESDDVKESLSSEIEKILHEMGQPFISRSLMKNRAELLIKYLVQCDELGCSKEAMISFVEDTLNKAMRADWKYHVLHELSKFNELYQIHISLQKDAEDLSHNSRLTYFKTLFYRIEQWAQKGELYLHLHEIEVDVSDLKAELQEVLAAVQRAVKSSSLDESKLIETESQLKHQLLEYRYEFGEFFLKLINDGDNGRQLRYQFLFVDQYLESIENLLQNIKARIANK